MTAYDDVCARLAERTGGTGRGGSWPCPAHDDRNPSLAVTNGDGKVLLHCHAGCDTADVLAALDLTAHDLYDTPRSNGSGITATYDYTDEHGTLLFQVVRKAGKRFMQRRPDGAGGWIWKLGDTRRVLYRLPELVDGVAEGATVFVVEGEKDADRLTAEGYVATCNPHGAGKWRPNYNATLEGGDVVIVADRDQAGYAHAADIASNLDGVATSVRVVEAATGKDVSDHLAAGLTVDQLVLVDAPAIPCTLEDAHKVFRRWLGDDYDLDALNATLATAAAEQLGGDPLWLLLVSGSGNAKTETVQALSAAGAHIVSTIASEGALLSGSPKQQRTKDATGGLLRQIGDRGLLVIKDVTSILSMNRDTRASVLAAFRELHDGRWVRYLGVDGGRTLEWAGRIVIVGAVTTAWDRAHDVIASMGDRFLILRMDSSDTDGRMGAGRQSRRNVGHETQMRAELADAVAGVLAGADLDGIEVTDDEAERLLAAADLVTLARTGVDYDYRGDVIDTHAPEMPTRFMKQLVQVVRGAAAIGMGRGDALRLAVRCARDSMPPMRLAILDDIAEHTASTPTEVRRRLDKPRSTVDRQLQSLHILGVARLDEEEEPGRDKPVWRYSLADGIDPSTLRPSPDLSPPSHSPKEKRERR